MKPKIFVLIALMLSLLAIGIILIVGYANSTLLPLYLIIFLLAFFALNMFFLKDNFTEKTLIIAGIILVLLTISSTLLLTNLKTYYDVSSQYDFENSEEFIQTQLDTDYYLAYANYLNERVIEYNNKTKLMENQLAELKKIELEQLKQETIIVPPPEEINPIIYEEYYEYYYEEYEEEDEEDDDDD
ncbi:MAG: hypothetical protein ACP5N1_04905 [Candidatus Woesearchaeota archaeon]